MRGAVGLARSLVATALFSSMAAARRVFITGATDGIGRHTANRLAREGYSLLVHGRSAAKGEALVAELLAGGARDVRYFSADLSDLPATVAMAEEVRAALEEAREPLDVLVNNAGVFDPRPQLTAQGLDATWQVNVVAPYVITIALLPSLLRSRSPLILTTSSMIMSRTFPLHEIRTGAIGRNPHAAYGASKLGDYMLASGLARRLDGALGPDRVRSVAFHPGVVGTKMLAAGWGAGGTPVSQADNTARLILTDLAREGPNGGFFFGEASSEGRKQAKLDRLFALLEEQSGVALEPVVEDLRERCAAEERMGEGKVE